MTGEQSRPKPPRSTGKATTSSEIINGRPKAVLLLWRHEQSEANADRRRIQGFNPTVPLSELGRARAQRSGGPALRTFLDSNGLEVVAVRTSEAIRAQQTARLVLAAAGVEVTPLKDKRLNEQCKGDKVKGGVEDMDRDIVETAAYKARQVLEGWDFRPGVDDQPGVAASGAETPREVARRWLDWRNDLTAMIEAGSLPSTTDPNNIPCVVTFGHNLITASGLGAEQGITVLESKKLYRVDNGEALVLGYENVWNLDGRLYRPPDT